MKKIIVCLLAITMFAAVACGKSAPAEKADEAPVSMANPWTDTDEAGFMEKLGMYFAVPEGAENVIYRVLESEGLGEMQFELDGLSFTARIQSASEFTDISGMYYEWTVEDSGKVDYCDCKFYRYVGEEEYADLCLWYDVVPGIMYSLSTVAPDLDGFDISAIANQVFEPMQSES